MKTGSLRDLTQDLSKAFSSLCQFHLEEEQSYKRDTNIIPCAFKGKSPTYQKNAHLERTHLFFLFPNVAKTKQQPSGRKTLPWQFDLFTASIMFEGTCLSQSDSHWGRRVNCPNSFAIWLTRLGGVWGSTGLPCWTHLGEWPKAPQQDKWPWTCSQEFLYRIKDGICFLLQQSKKPGWGGGPSVFWLWCQSCKWGSSTPLLWRTQQVRDDTDVSSCHAQFLQTPCATSFWFGLYSCPSWCPLHWASMRADVELGK